MYSLASIADWSDAELLELWLERVAMRLMPVDYCTQTDGDIRQAEYMAAKEVRQWCGGRHLPAELVTALRKFR